MRRRDYPSDMTNAEWKILESLIPTAKEGGRVTLKPRCSCAAHLNSMHQRTVLLIATVPSLSLPVGPLTTHPNTYIQ
jgi:hypothetical protein